MLVKLYNGDDYLEVDTELSTDEIDTLVKIEEETLEDTLEISLDELSGDENGD